MPFRVIEMQPTPNPDATKFVLDSPISEQPTSFFNAEQAKSHPVAAALFAIPGVTSVLLLGDFVTVNKSKTTPWSKITPKVRDVLSSS